MSKLQKEKDFLAQTSDSLLRNQDDFRTQLAAEQAKVKARDAQVADLSEQVCAFVCVTALPACLHQHCTAEKLLSTLFCNQEVSAMGNCQRAFACHGCVHVFDVVWLLSPLHSWTA